MFKCISLCVLLTVFQGALLQMHPAHICGPPPVDNPLECCKIPQLFTDEDRKECGVDIMHDKFSHPNCDKIKCVFKRNNLIADDELDKDALGALMDKWAEANSEFKDATAKAKEECLNREIPEDRKFCEPGQRVGCLFAVILHNCPHWQENDQCSKFKDFIEECHEKLKKGLN